MKESRGLKKLLVHVSNYSFGSLLTTIAGIVSFPILTRLLSTDEYGLMSLIGVTLTLIVAIGKLGLQNPVVRFYSDVKSGVGEWNISQYYSTVIYGMLVIGSITTFLWFLLLMILPDNLLEDDRLKFLLLVTSVLIVSRIMESSFSNILRARQRSKVLVIFNVARRYSILISVLVTLLYISQTLYGVFYATIVVELIFVVIFSYVVLKGVLFKLKDFSPKLLKQMLIFGIPLLGHEFAWILLNTGDRYLLQWYLGPEKVGVYTAAYSVCDYVRIILIMSLYQALPPMYLRIWNEKGEGETRKLVERSFHFYVMVALPVAAGLSVVGPTLLNILASEKYSSGASIIPYVIFGMVINGSVVMYSAGLYIHKKGKVLMLLTIFSALLNVILNMILIPLYGITGAAIATLISYVCLALSNKIVSTKYLMIRIPWVSIIKFGTTSLLMYLLIDSINLSNSFFTMLLQTIVGIVFYSLFILVLDDTARNIARNFLYRLKIIKS